VIVKYKHYLASRCLMIAGAAVIASRQNKRTGWRCNEPQRKGGNITTCA